MRLGLGCMRLEDDAVIQAALEAGITVLDTAHAYDGSEERIGRVLDRDPAARSRVVLVTKVGMTRPGGAWIPDGRAKVILEQARESKARLGQTPTYLMLHAPDPSVSIATSVRALLKARDEGLTTMIGLSNPTRRHLDEIEATFGSALMPSFSVEVALGPKHDAAARAGLLAWCKERELAMFVHSPLGGVAHAPKLARDTVLSAIAKRYEATAAEIMLAYLLALGSHVIPLPGARRRESVASMVRAGALQLGEEDLALLDARFTGLGAARRPPPMPASPTAEVVMVMGIAGAGKSSLMTRFEGYERLNRDLLGGTLAGVAKKLEAMLAAGATRVVLDNTYTSRSARNEVIRVAHRANAAVKCIYLETSLADARVNVVNRMLERHGELLSVKDFRAKKDPNLLGPTLLSTMHKQLERPALDEGLASIETLAFTRRAGTGRAGAAVPLENLAALSQIAADVPVLVFGWNVAMERARERLAHALAEEAANHAPHRPVIEVAICQHGDGPPSCWCRPPLPGLWLAFARKYGLDARASTMFAKAPSHHAMAEDLGMKLVHG